MIVALTLLHLLVLVYWLGGDLGAFYAGRLVTETGRTPAERAVAARVLGAVDMAPRTTLILAAPTGLTLALAKGWIAWPPGVIVGVWVFALVWLAMAWRVHLKHLGPDAWVRRADIYIRLLVLAALVGLAGLALAGRVEMPLFMALKCLLLAGAICAGLVVRRLLRGFGPAFAAMMAKGATPETDAVIHDGIARCRPVVVLLWGFLLCAALLGVATPA